MPERPPDVVVVGLGFGDEGKGGVVDFLTRRVAADGHGTPLIVRFNGGPQAAHRVVTTEGQEHIFAQFGSGSFVSDAHTLLLAAMLVDPFALEAEATQLLRCGMENVEQRIHAAPECVVVTPYHRLVNRVKELLRGAGRHGSCGMGVGEARFDAVAGRPTLLLGDLRKSARLQDRLDAIQEHKLTECRDLLRNSAPADCAAEVLAEIGLHEGAGLNDDIGQRLQDFARRFAGVGSPEGSAQLDARHHSVLYEGAQGALLDERRGFFPFVSVTDTSARGALEAALAGGRPRPRVLGVLRALPTRHGPGPFVTHDEWLTRVRPDPVNAFGRWQREFRVGWFDLVAARYALSFATADGLAITGLDRLSGLSEVRFCTAYAIQETDLFGGAGLAPDGESLFCTDGRLPDGSIRITDIRTSSAPSQAEQRLLANLLLRARPLYETLPSGATPEAFVDRLQEALGVTVVLRSFGPSALDREFDSGFLACERRGAPKAKTL